jgi:3-dehydroquinate dehydratase/shikimate dehydrogenase
MTRLTAAITADSLEQALHDLQRSAQAGAQQVEIRLDHLESVDFNALVCETSLPIVWTLRHCSEGGKFTGLVAEQIDALIEALDAGGEYVDIEFRRWQTAGDDKKRLLDKIAELRKSGRPVKLILSWHNFQCTPPDVAQIFQTIANNPHADVVKVACYAESIRDNFILFDLMKTSSKPAVAIAMGPLGAISRILAPKLGAELTFASLAEGEGSAPGQLTLETMKNEYNVDRIDHDTLIAGVVGHPVEHSLSPLIHNRAYQTMNQDAAYVKFDVADSYDDFCLFIDGLRQRRWLDVMGLSITIPHKTNALRYLKEHDEDIAPLAEKIGAVNTLIFHPDGKLSGDNTDYLGVLETLHREAKLSPADLAGKRVAVLGAGGVSRAIVAAMAAAQARITIYNRSEDKARQLAEEFICDWQPWDRRNQLEADIVINGISLGMHPNINTCSLEPSALSPGMIVFDTVYNPLETKLLKLARERGAQPVDGANMLVYQAAEQIKLWLTARQKEEFSIPIDIMKRAMLSKL